MRYRPLPTTEKEWDLYDDIDRGDPPTEPIPDVPWNGDEDVCPCCGEPKNYWSDECRDCFTSGRLRDFDRHPSADE